MDEEKGGKGVTGGSSRVWLSCWNYANGTHSSAPFILIKNLHRKTVMELLYHCRNDLKQFVSGESCGVADKPLLGCVSAHVKTTRGDLTSC